MYQAALALADVAVLNLQRFLFIRADHNLLSDATTYTITTLHCCVCLPVRAHIFSSSFEITKIEL